METHLLLAELRAQGARLAEAAATTPIDAPVPTCPGWVLRDLLLHTGGVHRWAETTVRERRPEVIELDQPHDIADRVPADDELVDWFRESHTTLVDTLERAADDLACFTFLPAPTAKAFWTRRQAHETAIHRVDAEATAGVSSPIDADLAADGIDELLAGFVPRKRELRAETPYRLRFETSDTGDGWVVTVSGDRPRTVWTTEHTGPVEATATGPADDLYRALWNRRGWDGLTVTGDTGLLTGWVDSVRVRWE